MSALGDYVHLTVEGYTGEIGNRRKPFYSSFQSSLTKKHNQYRNWLYKQEDNKKLKKLELDLQNQLDIIKQLDDKYKNAKASSRQSMEKDFIDAGLLDLYDNLKGKYLIADLVQSMTKGILSYQGAAAAYNYGSGKTAFQKQNIANANARIKESILTILNQYTDDVLQNVSKNTISQQKLASEITKCANQIQQLRFTIRGSYNSLSIDGNNYERLEKKIEKCFLDIFNELDLNKKNKAIKGQLKRDLKNFIDGLKESVSLTTHEGEISESLVTTVARKSVSLGAKEAIKIGDISSQRGYAKSFFIPSIELEELAKQGNFSTYSKHGEFLALSTAAQQEKIDVKIEFKDNSEPLKISVKNYNLSSYSIKIGGENFLALMQTENNENFLNHFLNINALSKKKNYDKQIRKRDVENINNLVKQILIIKQFTGLNVLTNNGQMNDANTFVVFDNKTYEVYVCSMQQILSVILNKNNSNFDNNFKILIDNIALSNTKQLAITTRLVHILRELNYRTGKIDVSKKDLQLAANYKNNSNILY